MSGEAFGMGERAQRRLRAAVSSLSLAGLLVGGCGGGGGNGSAPPPSTEDPSHDYTTFDVGWRDGVVDLDDVGAAQRALRRADVEAGELVFDPAYAGLSSLVVGSPAVIGGIGVFRVTGRETATDGELVHVDAAPLTDVIDHGTIAWRRSIVSSSLDSRAGLGIDNEDEAADLRAVRSALGSYSNGELSYSGVIGSFTTTMNLKPSAAGLELGLTAKYKDGENVANAALSATLHGMTNETQIHFDSSGVQVYDVRFIDVDGDVHIEAGAVQVGGDTKVKIPARLAFPILVGVIPFNIELGTSLEFSSTLVTNTSAIFKANTKFKGTAGARVEGSNVQYFGDFQTAELTLESSEQVGTVTAGLDYLLNFPEVSVGIGLPKVATANAFLRFKSEVNSNFTLKYDAAGPFPVITGNCLETGVNLGATYGGKVAFLGIDLVDEEHQLYGKLGDKKRTGTACDQP